LRPIFRITRSLCRWWGIHLPLVPDGVPVKGHAVATFNAAVSSLVDADLDWEENQGQLVVISRDNPDRCSTCRAITRSSCPSAMVAGTGSLRMPLSGRIGLSISITGSRGWRKPPSQAA
jgi:hypothetical protein